MPRIILFGKSKRRTRTTYHLRRAFKESGNEILWLNPARIRRHRKERANDWILDRIDRFQPDMIFIYSLDIPLPVLQQIVSTSIKTVMYYEDMPRQISSDMVTKGALVDWFLVTNKGLNAEYRKRGIANPVYFTGACDRYDHRRRHPLLPIWTSDVAFIGQARNDEIRLALVKKLGDLYNLNVYGRNWQEYGFKPTLRSVAPRRYGLICSASKIMLGADITSNVDGYWSNRLWLTLGSGGFFLTNYTPGLEKFFENRKHLVWYHSEQECVDLAKEYLAKPMERKKIAMAGYRLVHEHHTFHDFVERVFATCT